VFYYFRYKSAASYYFPKDVHSNAQMPTTQLMHNVYESISLTFLTIAF